MKPSLRFLAVVTIGWIGVRAYTLGAIPSGSFSLVERSEAKNAPSIVPTEFPSIDPVQPADAASLEYSGTYGGQMPQTVPLQIRPVAIPVYYGVNSVRVPLPPARPREAMTLLPEPRRPIYTEMASADESPLSRLASMALGPFRSSPVPMQSTPVLNGKSIDRWQVSAWALVRNQQIGVLGPSSLANGGNLGGSQAGARLTYFINRQIAASFRTSSDLARRGFEVAGGVRVQPLQSIPVWITAERRQRVGEFGGRNAFAVFAETGLYQRALPWRLDLDAYLQGGVVGVKSRDLFVDGSVAITRPVYRNFSAGLGVWGGAQPGVYRVDVGPRISMQVRKNVRVHFDYRQRLAGSAHPGSGPAITLAADF